MFFEREVETPSLCIVHQPLHQNDAQPFNYSYRKEKVIYKKSKAKEYKNIII
jgi:hypothetical protein